MVYSVLLSVLHFKNILLVDPDRLLKPFYQSAVGVLRATQQAKRSSASEREMKAELKNGVRLFAAFCLTYILCITSSSRKKASGMFVSGPCHLVLTFKH